MIREIPDEADSREGGFSALVYAALLGIVVAVLLLGLALYDISEQSSSALEIGMQQVARQGAAVFAACAAQQRPGQYAPSQLIPGMADGTPWGNDWICETQSGGSSAVFYNGPALRYAGTDIAEPGDPGVQYRMAWNVAGLLYDLVSVGGPPQPGVIVAVAASGSWDAAVVNPAPGSPTSITLSGVLSAPLSYDTPIIIAGATTAPAKS